MNLPGWLPIVALPALVICYGAELSPCAVMWGMLGSIFAGFKWLTWWRDASAASPIPSWRTFAYLFAWPGMNATAFFNRRSNPEAPAAREWFMAASKTALGSMLVWGVARWLPSHHTPAIGWIGMVGIGFLVHFGAFHVLALVWQSYGIEAPRLFRSPGFATSVSDFWGSRWNLAFRDLAHSLVFRPLVGPIGPTGASMITFFVSGLVHELVISFPAGAGYGLPTAYFLLQSVGVLAERSSIARRLRLRRGITGWSIALAFTAGPAYWLFHPPFVDSVVIPLMHSIGAL